METQLVIKVLGCILILISSTILGFSYGERYKKRVKQLHELQRVIYQIESEIIYTHTTLPESFSNAALKSTSPINKLFFDISALLSDNKAESVYDAFKKSLEINKAMLDLSNEDINIVLDLSKTLGESDIDGQRKIFSLTVENIKKQIKLAEESMNKNVKIFRYLGFGFGALTIIMLI